ncbi:hypothetical protein HDU81_010242 [Chytriomyces hyalinus]|nr:hypothetical protein HDU81_010242 [Chytriomyces hyalinus]
MSRNTAPKPESAPKPHRNSIGKGVTETLGKLLSSLKIGTSNSKGSKSGMDESKEPLPIANDEKKPSFGRRKSSGSSRFSLASQKRDGINGEAEGARDIAASQETLADYASSPSETQYCPIEIRISDTGESDERILGSSASLSNDFENERAFTLYPHSIEPWQQLEPNYFPYDEAQRFEFEDYSPTQYDDAYPPEPFFTELKNGADWGVDPQIRGKLREPIRSFEEDGLIPIATQPGSISLSAPTRSRSWTSLFIEKTQTQTWKKPTRFVNSADSLKRPKKIGSPKCTDPKTKSSNRFQSRFSNERQPGSRRGSGAFAKGETQEDEGVNKRVKEGTRQSYATLRSSLRKNGRMAASNGHRFGSASHLSKIHDQNSLSVEVDISQSDSPNSSAGSPQIFHSTEKGLLDSSSYCIDDARHQGSSSDTSLAFSRFGSDTSAVSTTILENIVSERHYSLPESGHIFRSPSSYWSTISKHKCSTPDQVSDDSGASPSLHSFSKWPSFSTLSPSRTRVPAFKQQVSQDSINFSPAQAATARHDHRIGPSAMKRSVSGSSASRSSNAFQPISRAPSSRCRSKERHQVVESSVVYEKQDLYSLTQLTKDLGTADEKVQGKINQYVIIRDIGSGAYGAVKLCKNQINDFYYACKVISKSKLQKKFRWKSNAKLASRPNSAESEPETMPAIKKEIAILKKLSKHPNINVLVEVIDDDKEDNLYMFFELCERGPVMNIKVNEPDRPYSEELARHYFRDLLLGIEYRQFTYPSNSVANTKKNSTAVHKNRIIHRDIKPANLLLNKDRILQIADFGISHMFSEGEDDQIHDKNTSPLFCPPEACRMDSDGPTAVHGFPFDVWSMGVTLFCLVHGYCPFEDDCLPDLYNKICNDTPIISATLSQELNLLITAMLDKNPNHRPTIKQIRCDPWVLNYGSEPLISEEENCITEDVTEEDIRNAVGKRFMDQMIKVFRRLTSKMTIMVGSESPLTIGDASIKAGTPMGRKKQMGKSGSDILHAPHCHPSERGMKKYSSDSRLAEPVLDFTGVASLTRDLRTEDSQSAVHLTVPRLAQ